MIFFICFIVVVSCVHSKNVKSRLSELKDLYTQGLISSLDFEKYKKVILDENFGKTHSGKAVSTPEPPFRTLVWEDDFSFLDFSKWKHVISMSGGGNWEFEYYSNNRSNSFVQNGILHIQPTFTADTIGEAKMISGGDISLWGGTPADLCTSNQFWGCERSSDGNHILNPIQSARLRTAETFSFKYGKIEVNASLPKGDWIWPAIWLEPKDQGYGIWPASGEIDLVESRGNAAGYPAGGIDTMSSTLHWGPFYPEDRYDLTTASKKAPSGDFSNTYHVFGMEWDENGIKTYLDTPDNTVLDVQFTTGGFWQKGGFDKRPDLINPWRNGEKGAPFDQEFYIILNVAAGGTNGYFPDDVGGKPWKNLSPSAPLDFWKGRSQWEKTWESNNSLRVDFVRVYQ